MCSYCVQGVCTVGALNILPPSSCRNAYNWYDCYGYLIVYIYIVCVVMSHTSTMEQISGFRVKTWNVRGYLSSIPYIRHLLNDCDILCVSEHWLHYNRHYILNDISATHYVHVRSSRASCASNFGVGRGQGGVAIFWRKELSGISVVSEIIHDRVCAIRLQTGTGFVFYIFQYICQPKDVMTI